MPTVVLMKAVFFIRQFAANYSGGDTLENAKVFVEYRSPPSIRVWLHAYVSRRGSGPYRCVSGIICAGYVAQVFGPIVGSASVGMIRLVRPHTVSHCEEDPVLFGVGAKKTAAQISAGVNRRKGWLSGPSCIPRITTVCCRPLTVLEHIRRSFFPKEIPFFKVCSKVFRKVVSIALRHFDIQSLVCPRNIHRIRS